MLPSLIGIIASSGGAAAGGDYESIATVTVGSGGSASVSFTSIPSTYQHLQVRAFGRSDRAFEGDYLKLTFNSDSGSNYADHAMYGQGSSSVFTQAATSAAFIRLNRFAGSTALANSFGTIVLDVLDYANTNKYKTIRNLGGMDLNGAGDIWLMSGLWQSTSAVSTLTLNPGGGTAFSQYSSFALYGIKG